MFKLIFTEKKSEVIAFLSTANYNKNVLNLKSFLSTDEVKIYSRFKVDKRRCDFIAGRIVAKKCLEYFKEKTTPSLITIGTGVWGRPIIKSGEMVSIAHTQNFAAAISLESEIYPFGLDIEEVLDSNYESLNNFLSDYDLNNNLELMHIYWSAKEAAAKAIKTGFTIPLSMFKISEVLYDNGIYSIKFTNLSRLQAKAWLDKGVLYCVAFPIELEFISIINKD